ENVRDEGFSPSFSIYIGEVSFTISEFVEDLEDESVEIIESEDRLLSLVYRNEVEFADINQIIEIGSVENRAFFVFGEDTPASPIQVSIPFDQTFNFDFKTPNGERVDSVFYKSGSLVYHMESEYPASLDYGWTIVDMVELSTGIDINRSSFLEYNGLEITEDIQENLVEFKNIIRRDGDVNKFDVELNGNLILEPGNSISETDTMMFDLEFSNPEFNSLFGYFGNESIDIDGFDFSLDALSEFDLEGVEFSKPSITLQIENSFGIDMGLDFSGIRAEYNDGTSISFETDLTDTDLLVNSPLAAGEVRLDTIVLNASNSNLEDLLNGIPDRLVVGLNAALNPEASLLKNNFITDSSYIRVNSIIEIPLILSIQDYAAEFEMSVDALELDEVKQLSILVDAINELPFDGTISLELLDDTGELLHRFDDAVSFSSALIGEDGRTIGNDSTRSEVFVSPELISVVESAANIKTVINLSTSNQDPGETVKIYADYEMKVKLGLIGELNIPIEL
ncbi:MAG: hypothetical protein OCD76_21015, partial [Reichenbachiella sp.]